MDKSFNAGLFTKNLGEVENQFDQHHDNIQTLEKKGKLLGSQDLSKKTAFTPTRKSYLLGSDMAGTVSQERISQELIFEPQNKQKCLNLLDHINVLESRVRKLEKNQAKIKKSKRIRRKNTEIQKNFMCKLQNCFKNYGTETALNRHIELKHKGKKEN